MIGKKAHLNKYMKGYLLHYEEFSSPPFPVCELLRDDELKDIDKDEKVYKVLKEL